MLVYIGLGSNLGDRKENILSAVNALKERGVSVSRMSSWYESKALVPRGAPSDWNIAFLNSALECKTNQSPMDLLILCKEIEKELGRESTERWAPRKIDIDILVYGNRKVSEEGLVIPHPEITRREFVLNPLAQLCPTLVLPGATDDVLTLSRKVKNHRAQIMGILNLTPDSFSDGGVHNSSDALFEAVNNWVKEGVDIIDIGAESTRPSAKILSHFEEWERLVPAIESVSQYCNPTSGTKISVDTYHVETAKKCMDLGVHIINDVSGLTNPEMLELATHGACDFIAMHNLGLPADKSTTIAKGSDPVEVVKEWIEERIHFWSQAGIDLNRIVIDPGIGFGKTADQSLQLLNKIEVFQESGLRVLVGHSRKSFMNLFTVRDFSKRDPETLGASLNLNARGVDILRVHNPTLHTRALRAWYQVQEQ